MSMWHFHKLYKVLPAPHPRRPVRISDNLGLLGLSVQSSNASAVSGEQKSALYQKEHHSSLRRKPNSHITRDREALLVPETQLNFVYEKYSFVISLDTSRSMFSVDAASGAPLFDRIFRFLQGLFFEAVRPVLIPNTFIKFCPEMLVSIVAYGTTSSPVEFLLEGFRLRLETLPNLLELVRHRLLKYKRKIVRTLRMTSAAVDAGGKDSSTSSAECFVCQVSDLEQCLRNAAFALKMLPPQACPIVVIVTDGVALPPPVYDYDNLIMQFNRHGTSINAIRVESKMSRPAWGYVHHADELENMCAATGGTLLRLTEMSDKKLMSLWEGMRRRLGSGHLDASPSKVHCCLLWRFSYVTTHINSQRLRRGGLGRRKSRRETWRSNREIQSSSAAARPDTTMLRDIGEQRIVSVTNTKKGIVEYRLPGYVEAHDIMLCRILEGFQVQKLWIGSFGRGQSSVSSPPPSPTARTAAGDVIFMSQLEYWWQPQVRIVYSFWVMRKTQDMAGKWSRHVTVKIGTDGPVHLLRKVFGKTQTVTSTTMAPSRLLNFVREIKYCDSVLARMKQPITTTSMSSVSASLDTVDTKRAFAIDASSTFDTTNNMQKTGLDSNDKYQRKELFIRLIGSLTLKLLHRWFFVERFEVLCSFDLTSTLSSIGVDKSIGTDRIRTIAERSREALRSVLMGWATMQLQKNLFLRMVASEDESEDASGDTKSTTFARRAQKSRRMRRRGAFCLVRVEWAPYALVAAIHISFLACKPSVRHDIVCHLQEIVGRITFDVTLDSTTTCVRLDPVRPVLRIFAPPHSKDFRINRLTNLSIFEQHEDRHFLDAFEQSCVMPVDLGIRFDIVRASFVECERFVMSIKNVSWLVRNLLSPRRDSSPLQMSRRALEGAPAIRKASSIDVTSSEGPQLSLAEFRTLDDEIRDALASCFAVPHASADNFFIYNDLMDGGSKEGEKKTDDTLPLFLQMNVVVDYSRSKSTPTLKEEKPLSPNASMESDNDGEEDEDEDGDAEIDTRRQREVTASVGFRSGLVDTARPILDSVLAKRRLASGISRIALSRSRKISYGSAAMDESELDSARGLDNINTLHPDDEDEDEDEDVEAGMRIEPDEEDINLRIDLHALTPKSKKHRSMFAASRIFLQRDDVTLAAEMSTSVPAPWSNQLMSVVALRNKLRTIFARHFLKGMNNVLRSTERLRLSKHEALQTICQLRQREQGRTVENEFIE
eukprot:g884.t1